MGLDDTQQKVLTALKRKRGEVKESLTRIQKFVNDFQVRENAIKLLEFRQEELVTDRKFDEIQFKIKLIHVDDAEKDKNERKSPKLNHRYVEHWNIQELINSQIERYDTVHNSSFSSANRSKCK